MLEQDSPHLPLILAHVYSMLAHVCMLTHLLKVGKGMG